MARCEVCGNDYDKPITASLSGGPARTFDSIECLAHALAPQCAHCGCRILGHGNEAQGKLYCCAHCARHSGEKSIRDRA
jgi:hypothetical protein